MTFEEFEEFERFDNLSFEELIIEYLEKKTLEINLFLRKNGIILQTLDWKEEEIIFEKGKLQYSFVDKNSNRIDNRINQLYYSKILWDKFSKFMNAKLSLIPVITDFITEFSPYKKIWN